MFSEKLASAMRQKKISTRMLSELTGIPKSAIQRYTSGDTDKIPIDRMKKMAEALNIDPAYVLGWSDSPALQEQSSHPQNAPATPADPQEAELVAIYRDLNTEGQGVLMGTARGLAANPDMKRGSESYTEMA